MLLGRTADSKIKRNDKYYTNHIYKAYYFIGLQLSISVNKKDGSESPKEATKYLVLIGMKVLVPLESVMSILYSV